MGLFDRVAQLVEHYLDMVVVVGSSPIVITIFKSLAMGQLDIRWLYMEVGFTKKF